MSKPRILHVASGDLWGGAEAAVFELCRSLYERDVDVRAMILNPGELASRLAAVGVQTTVMDERTHSSWRIFVELQRASAAFRPHVIHTHRKKEHILACAAARFLPAARPSLVKTIHGAPEPRFGPPGLRVRLSQALDHWCDRQFAARVAVSNELTAMLSNKDTGVFLTIHNGIRPVPGALRERAPSTPRVVGFAGRFVPIKRLDLLIQIAAGARNLAPGALRFEIAGAGPLREELIAQTRAAGVADIVTFVPFQSDIWNTLGSWDVVILTSDHEGLPMICLEALAAGVPVFARRVGGLREVVLGPEQGILTDSTDPVEIAALLLKFVGQQSESAPARRRSRLPAMFTSDRMCEGYLDVYRKLAGCAPIDSSRMSGDDVG
jgi:glycosyltransferase involved in cell wall biosynthesis